MAITIGFETQCTQVVTSATDKPLPEYIESELIAFTDITYNNRTI